MIIFNAILPTFLVIMTGYGVRQFFLKDAGFWKQADWLIYYVMLPLMLTQTMAQASFKIGLFQYGLTIFAVVSVMALLCFVMRRFVRVTNAEFTSVFQGVVRTNFYISLSLVSILYGKEGMAFLSFLLIFVIFSSTVYSILVLARYGSGHGGGMAILGRLARNPIILSTFAGIFIAATFGSLPAVLERTFDIFADATLPLALLGIGASLEFRSLLARILPVLEACFLRLVVAPFLCLAVCLALGMAEMEAVSCILMFAVPSAASSITFASQMGGDKSLMSSILTVQTVASFVSLSFFITLTQTLL